MSLDAMGFVVRYSPYKDSTFLAHLLIADIVNDAYDNEFFMAQANLADKARLSKRSVWNALQRLSEDGFLTLLEDNRRTGKPNRYRFEFPSVPVVFEPGVRKICEPGSQRLREGTQDLRGGFAPVAINTEENPTDPQVELLRVADALPTIDDHFAAFWEVYPKKRSRPDALKAFRAAMKTSDVEAIAEGLGRWVRYWEKQNDKQFVPYPATWLRRESWRDDPWDAVA